MTSCFFRCNNDWELTIPQTRENEGITWFQIQLRVGSVHWNLEHRYREFSELNKALVSNHSVSKELLPPKVFFKKMTPEILESRRKGLEIYMNSVLKFLSNTMPPPLVAFLGFDKYDMWFLLKHLASRVRAKNWIENPPKRLNMSIIEVSALSERLKLPCPPVGVTDSQVDFCSVLEFVTLLKDLTIFGEDKDFFGHSNINYGNIPFELSSFRSLRSLSFSQVKMGNFVKADDARTQLCSLKIQNCKLKSIADALLCDNIHKNWKQITSGQVWQALKTIDFSHNDITEIDSGLELMPGATDLNISFNRIENFREIGKLQHLRVLKMSHNHITTIEDESIVLPCLSYLDLSNNEISNINGIKQFPALETLNLSFNRLDKFDELDHISSLQCILNVDLVGNPLSQKTDYRVKALGKFGKRTPLLCLDNEQCTAHELELIALVQALKFVQEGRTLSYNKNLSLNI